MRVGNPPPDSPCDFRLSRCRKRAGLVVGSRPGARQPLGRQGAQVSTPDPSRILIAVATYDERSNLEELLAAIRRAALVDVLVIDDNSPDGTGRLADDLAKEHAWLRV